MMAGDLPQEEFGYGASREEGARRRPRPPDDPEAWFKSAGMSDEGRNPPEDDLELELPEWLKQSGTTPEDWLADAETAPSVSWQPMKPVAAVVPAVPRRRYIFKSSEVIRVSPRTMRIRVKIVSAAGEFTGEAEGPQIPGTRPETAARAALDALNRAEGGKVALALKGARILRVFESPLVVVGVYGQNTGQATPLVGACMVYNSAEQASILATLQAADRWLAWQARERSNQ
jgi:hypothetical protein